MMNFLDWLGGSGGGAQGQLEKQFGLRPEDTRRATEALAPAYLLGLQRLAGDVDAWTRLIRSAVPGTGTSGGPAGIPAFFGSDALTRAVAGEASRHSGLPTEMLVAMMPTLSAMTVEAVMRMAVPGGRQAMPTDPFGATAAEMLRRSANAVEAFSRPAAPAAPAFPAAPFLDFFQLPWMSAFGAARPIPKDPPPPAPTDIRSDPFQPAAAFLAAFTKGLAAEKPAPSPVPSSAPPETVNPFLSLVSAGQDAQADYARRLGDLFTAHPAAKSR